MPAQCPTAALKGGRCTPDTLTVQAIAQGPGPVQPGTITWYDNGQLVKTVSASFGESPATIVAGGNSYGAAADQLYLPIQLYLDGGDNQL